MTLAKAGGLKLVLPLRKPSLSWCHPSGVTFAAPFKWGLQASLQILLAVNPRVVVRLDLLCQLDVCPQ
jgi:hypothetical protein